MCKPLPYLEVAGTHPEIGTAIGSHFKDKISTSIRKRKREVLGYDSYLPKSQQCYDITKKFLPNLIAELEAMARAAGVPALDLFFMNNREVYDEAEQYDRRDVANPDHCTVVAGYGPDGTVIGHNEDWSKEAIDDIYILKATVQGAGAFIGLNYCNGVPGLSASLNNHGLVQCINDLYSDNGVGIPKNFIARAVLECKSLDEAERLIRELPHASGFNHVLAQHDEIRNIEIAGQEISVERVIRKPYVHTNHFLSPLLSAREKFHTKSSEARYERAVTLLKQSMSIEDIMTILRDTNNKDYPICREEETIGSVVFVPDKLQSYFCYGHPCAGEYVEYYL